jgi:hypothetical protein
MTCAFCGGAVPPRDGPGPRATYCRPLCKWRAKNRRRHPPPRPDALPATLDDLLDACRAAGDELAVTR